MRFSPTRFSDAWLIEPERLEDDRGYFARTWCQGEFAEHGIRSELVQCSVSFNKSRGTLRGMHFQASPHPEAKLVRCTQGRIFDVIVDVRTGSSTFGLWEGFELSAANGHALYIPEGFAHGFQTLEPNSEVFYQMNERYHPESARAFHHADPSVAILWPIPVTVISEKDDANLNLDSVIDNPSSLKV